MNTNKLCEGKYEEQDNKVRREGDCDHVTTIVHISSPLFDIELPIARGMM